MHNGLNMFLSTAVLSSQERQPDFKRKDLPDPGTTSYQKMLEEKTFEDKHAMPETFLKISRNFFPANKSEAESVAARNIPAGVSAVQRAEVTRNIMHLTETMRAAVNDHLQSNFYVYLTNKAIKLGIKTRSGATALNFNDARDAWKQCGPCFNENLGPQTYKLVYETKENPKEWNPLVNSASLDLKLWGSVDDPKLDLIPKGPLKDHPLASPIGKLATDKFRDGFRTPTLKKTKGGHGWTLQISTEGGRAQGQLPLHRKKGFHSENLVCLDPQKSDKFYAKLFEGDDKCIAAASRCAKANFTQKVRCAAAVCSALSFSGLDNHIVSYCFNLQNKLALVQGQENNVPDVSGTAREGGMTGKKEVEATAMSRRPEAPNKGVNEQVQQEPAHGVTKEDKPNDECKDDMSCFSAMTDVGHDDSPTIVTEAAEAITPAASTLFTGTTAPIPCHSPNTPFVQQTPFNVDSQAPPGYVSQVSSVVCVDERLDTA